MLERAKKLKAKLPGANQDVHFNQLSISTLRDIDAVIADLEVLLKVHSSGNHAPLVQKFKSLKECIYELDNIENWPVASLSRQNEDDAFLNDLINRICREINYPLIPPVVSCLSQHYYYIIPQYNLMCVPLLESDFLLHIPDVYHELGHTIIDSFNNPKVEPYQLKLGGFISQVIVHFDREIVMEQRKTSSLFDAEDKLYNWKDCWAKNWVIEFFCDLLGVFCIGPAFAWGHIHLCIKRGGDPFEVPHYQLTEHPPDDARMTAILLALDLLGFKDEKLIISSKWSEYVNLCGYKAQPEYYKAIPPELLEMCVTYSLDATKKIGINLAAKDSSSSIYTLLNAAWETFLSSPETYVSWEKNELNRLR
jgi:hypothetical protein